MGDQGRLPRGRDDHTETRKVNWGWLNEEDTWLGSLNSHFLTLSPSLSSTREAWRASSCPGSPEAGGAHVTKFSQCNSNRSLPEELETAGGALSHSSCLECGCNTWSYGSHLMTIRQQGWDKRKVVQNRPCHHHAAEEMLAATSLCISYVKKNRLLFKPLRIQFVSVTCNQKHF